MSTTAKKKAYRRYTENLTQKMDLQGIEPWTTPMLREYYTTKPQARCVLLCLDEGLTPL
jgi:hypothetical protein